VVIKSYVLIEEENEQHRTIGIRTPFLVPGSLRYRTDCTADVGTKSIENELQRWLKYGKMKEGDGF
jgi:hypothetical protein